MRERLCTGQKIIWLSLTRTTKASRGGDAKAMTPFLQSKNGVQQRHDP